MKKNFTLSVHLIFSGVFTNLLFFCFLSTMPSMALGNNNDNGQKAKSKLQKAKVNLRAVNTNAIYSKSLSTSVDDATNSELTMPTGTYIPDANFAAAIRTACSSCIDNSHNLTAAAASLTYLSVAGNNIKDLTGIDGFTNLTDLNCSFNSLTVLPTLPTGLISLNCYNDTLTSLPTLPTGLISLNCYNNTLTSLPNLPSGLQYLDCYNNSLTSLPTVLPSSLRGLDCRSNKLNSLPTLPSTLQKLNCSLNKLTSLPTLPSTLTELYCYYNSLTSLPTLPSSLQYLECSQNQLTSLPPLPSGLQFLDCYNNKLTSLPTLPSTLTELYCSSNQLTSLPTLPSSLQTLDCFNNSLTSLPTLPSRLQRLHCYSNSLTSLPTLPSGLIDLYCQSNSLTSLPTLPSGLLDLRCYSNKLTSLPTLPSFLQYLAIDYPAISCLPNSVTGLIVHNQKNNNITSTIPLCTLPLQWLAFNAQKMANDNTVRIDWVTASEENVKNFMLQRSSDGSTFQFISEPITAKKTTSENSYSFDDLAPLNGVNYYRAEEIDFDGVVSYSKVIALSLNSSTTFNVYPTIVADELNILSADNNDFQVINLLGKVVMTAKNALKLNVALLPSGIYFLKSGTELMRFLKQ